jgi:hypothetical protein
MPNDAGINIDSVDQGRQALAALRGYRHQLIATALAWTHLQAGEVLLVEVAEDYATIAKQAVAAIQVKSGSTAATLRTKDVVTLLNSRWRFRRTNPDFTVEAVFLTTAEAGHEQGGDFPGGAKGIDYWRIAAREGADIAPLRAFLLKLPLESDFKTWLASAADEALRSDLLRRVHWECGAPSTSELEPLLLDAILNAGAPFGLPPHQTRACPPDPSRDGGAARPFIMCAKASMRTSGAQGLARRMLSRGKSDSSMLINPDITMIFKGGQRSRT